MPITLTDWLGLPDKNGPVEIVDTVTNLLTNPIYNDPVLGLPLRTLMDLLTSTLGATLTVTVNGSVGLAGLTPDLITRLVGNHATGIDPLADSTVSLSLVQSLADAGLGIVNSVVTTVSMTPTELGALTPQGITNLVTAGVDLINPGGDATLPLSTIGGLVDAGLSIVNSVVTTVSMTPTALGTLTPAGITDLVTAGVDLINPGSDATMPLSVVEGLVGAGLGIVDSVLTTVSMTPTELGTLTPQGITDLVTAGIDLINPGGDATMPLSVVEGLVGAGLGIVDSVLTTVSMTPTELGTLTPQGITDLVTAGVDLINPGSDAAMPLSVVEGLVGAGLGVVDSVLTTVSMTPTELGTLTPQGITDLVTAGIDLINPGGDATMPLSVVEGLVGAGLGIVDSVLTTVSMTPTDLGTLTPQGIADLVTAGVDLINPGGDATMPLSVVEGLVGAGLGIVDSVLTTVTMTPTDLGTLTPQGIADLVTAGIDLINPGGDATMPLSVVEGLVDAGLGIVESVLTTVLMTPAELEALTPEGITDLVNAGVDLINPGSDATLPLSVVEGLLDAGLGLVNSGLLAVSATAEEISNLSPDTLAGLAAAGVDILDAAGNAVSLSLDQVETLLSSGLNLGPLDHITLLETAGNIAAMTLDVIANLLTAGVNVIDVSDGNTVYITAAQALAFYASGTTFEPSDNVAVRDSASHIEQLSVAQITNIGSIGVDFFDSTINALSLSLAQINAIVAENIAFAPEDAITAVDTADNLGALTSNAIATLAANGISAIDSTDDVLTLSLSQFNAINNGAIALADDDVVTLADSAGAIAGLTASQIATLATKGIDEIDVVGNAISLSAVQAKAFAANGLAFVDADVVTLVDTAANISALTTSEIAALKAAGVDAFSLAGGTLTLTVAQAQSMADAGMEIAGASAVVIADTGAHVAAIGADDIAALAAIGIESIDLTDNAASLSLSDAKAFANAGLGFAANDIITLVDSGANIASITPADIAALKALGVDSVDITNDAVAISAAQAAALVGAGLTLAVEDIGTIADTGSHLAALTVQQIADLATIGIDAVDAVNDALALTVAQLDAFASAGIDLTSEDVITLADTGANLAGLTTSAISALIGQGVDKLDAVDDAVSLSAAQLKALAATGLAFAAEDIVTLVDTAANIGSLSVSEIAALKNAGVDIVDATDGALTMTIAQVQSFVTAGIQLASADGVEIVDSGAHVASVAVNDIAALAAAGVDSIDLTDNAAILALANARALAAAGLTFAANDVVTIADTGANIATLSGDEIVSLKALGVDTLDVTDNALGISAAQAAGFANAGIAFAGNDVVTIIDTAVNIATLTETQIANLGAGGVDVVDSISDALTLSIAQLNAYAAAGIELTQADVITLADTGANIAGLTTSAISALIGQGVDKLDAIDDAVSLGAAQLKALAATGLAFAAEDVVTLVDTAANIGSLSVSEIAALKNAGVDIVDATDGALTMTIAQVQSFVTAGIQLASGDGVEIVDSGAHVASVAVNDIAALAAAGVDSIDLTDNAATLALANARALAVAGLTFAANDVITIADTGANIATLSGDEIVSLKALGVDTLDVTDNALGISAAQAAGFANAGIAFAGNDVVTIIDTAVNIATLTETQIANLGAGGVDVVDSTSNALTLSIAQLNAYAAAGIELTQADVITLGDTGANIAGLTVSEISGFAAQGVDAVDVVDNNLSASLAQITAFSTAGLAFASDDIVRLADTGANIASLSATDIADLKAKGVSGVDATDDAARLTVAQANAFVGAALSFAAEDFVTMVASTNEIKNLNTSEITGFEALGVDIIDAKFNRGALTVAQAEALIDASIDIVDSDKIRLKDTAAHIKALTTDDIAHFKDISIDLIDTIGKPTTINVAQAKALAASGVEFIKSDVVRLLDTSANIDTMTKADFRHLRTTHVDTIDVSNNQLTLTAAEYKALGPVRFAANDVVTVKGTGHHDALNAHGGHMVLDGGNGRDVLVGGAKKDVLDGGLQSDVLKGGSGADEFRFDTSLGKNNVDRIQNFNTAHDHIALDDAIFKAIGKSLGSNEFHIGTSAHDRNDHIIYDKAAGELYYDHDGKGHDAAVKFATVAHGLDLSALDFLII